LAPKKMTLIKTDYEEGRLQPTLAGHPQLATPRANYFLLVMQMISFFFEARNISHEKRKIKKLVRRNLKLRKLGGPITPLILIRAVFGRGLDP
jgi:hypothetical protein